MVVMWFCVMLWVVDVLISVSFLLGKPQSAGTSVSWWLIDFWVTTGLGAMVFVLWRLWGSENRTQDAAVKQAVQAERIRISHELHDGLGFQLVNALSRSDGNPQEFVQMRSGIERALMDLHAVIDCIESESIGLLDLMADLRYRIQPALDRQGVSMRWHVPQDLVLTHLSSAHAKHLAKIAQEALSNTLQHATATEVRVSLEQSSDGTGLTLQVLDDGAGMEHPGSHQYGLGLAGMHRRAKLIGADLQITSGLREKGTGICVHVSHVATRSGALQ